MSIFFTNNVTTVVADSVPQSERLTTLNMQTYAGQTDTTTVRIGNTGTENQTLLVFSTDPNITLSTRTDGEYAPALNYTVKGGAVGDSIHIRLDAPLAPVEGERIGTIVCEGALLKVNYYLASTNEGTSKTKSQDDRYLGSETLNMELQFDSEGESVVLYRYDPVEKPVLTDKTLSRLYFDSLSVAEWCNPYNALVGYEPAQTYPTKAFVGTPADLVSNVLHGFSQDELEFLDTSAVLLPPDFDGFHPRPIHKTVLFSDQLTFRTQAFQQTQWTLKRHDGEYALTNIREQSYYKGQFLFWVADLVRVHYPASDSDIGFLPWNQLYNAAGKIIHYVRTFSTRAISEEPYLDHAIGTGAT